MIIETNGVKYFVEFHQQDTYKPNLIMLHGFMGSGRSFQFNFPLLKAFCNPITVDLIGHGKTVGTQPVERFSLEHQLSDISQIIKKASSKKPFLFGYSMGGRLALRYALVHPSRINGLILESTNYGIEEKRKISERKKIDEKRAQAIENDFKSFIDEWKTLPLFQGNAALPNNRLTRYQDIQAQQKPQQMANSLRGFGTAQMPSVMNKLDQLEPPVLLLAGERDEKYVHIMNEMHQLIPESMYSKIAGAGHRVHLDKPIKHSTAIKKFITKT